MSIDARCQEQRSAADRMFMDFKYTRPGSKEQIQALATLSFLIGMWADFLTAEEKRMAQVLDDIADGPVDDGRRRFGRP